MRRRYLLATGALVAATCLMTSAHACITRDRLVIGRHSSWSAFEAAYATRAWYEPDVHEPCGRECALYNWCSDVLYSVEVDRTAIVARGDGSLDGSERETVPAYLAPFHPRAAEMEGEEIWQLAPGSATRLLAREFHTKASMQAFQLSWAREPTSVRRRERMRDRLEAMRERVARVDHRLLDPRYACEVRTIYRRSMAPRDLVPDVSSLRALLATAWAKAIAV